MITTQLLPLSIALALPLAGTSTDDWPRWRGPLGDNVSVETGWSPVPGAELWRARIGRGYSMPLVSGERAFVCGYFDGDQPGPQAGQEAGPEAGTGLDRVACLDLATGAEVWSRTYPARLMNNEHGGGVIGTGTLADGVLYLPSRAGELRALDAESGAVLWEVDLVERHGVEPGRYGFASSPLVLGSDLILNAARTVRIDRETGATVWISEDYEANYSTAAPMRIGERDCLVIFGHVGAAILDAATGEQVHLYVFRETERNVEGATPIVMGTRVILSSAYDHGAALVDFGGDAPQEVWRSRRMRTKMAGATLFEGHLYGFDESMLKCVDLEGKELWRKRGLGQGALSIAGGRLLLTTSDGELIVAEAQPEAYTELSRTALIEGGVFWTAPVLAGGRIFVRGSLGDLVCLDANASPVAAAPIDTSPGATSPVATSPGTASGATPASSVIGANELVRGHLEAMGLGGEQAPQLSGIRSTGVLNNDALGLAGVATEWVHGPGSQWFMSFALPAGMPGKVGRYFDGERAWEAGPRGAPKWLEPRELAELRRTAGFGVLFDPLVGARADSEGGAPSVRSVGLEDFRGRRCHRVDVQLTDELVRSVFFDAATGLLAGRTAPDETTVVLDDWRSVGEVRLPFSRTLFDAELGQEWRLRFDAVVFERPEAGLFALPEELSSPADQEHETGQK